MRSRQQVLLLPKGATRGLSTPGAQAANSKVDVILVANLIPSHPSTYVLQCAVESIARHVRLPPDASLYIVHDGLSESASARRRRAYDNYKRRVLRWEASKETPVRIRTRVVSRLVCAR